MDASHSLRGECSSPDFFLIWAPTGREALSAGSTQKWAERASVYHIAGNEFTDKDLKEVHRDIPAGYYIRPIPQGQLDGMEMSPEEKDAYQNPAYR